MEDQEQLDQKGDRSFGKKDSALIMNNTRLFVPPGSGNSFIEQPYSIFKPTLTCLASLYLRTSQCICYCCHIGIGLFRPIMFNSHNLCELVSGSKLSKFSTSMLQDICNFYELDSSLVNGKRKTPYIDISLDFVCNCTCKIFDVRVTNFQLTS